MKRHLLKRLISILGLLGLVIVFFLVVNIYGIITFGSSMKTGQKIFENMSQNELIYFKNEALHLHSIDSLRMKGVRALFGKELKEEYREKGIKRIDVRDSIVSFIWMGGFDHTALTFLIQKNSVTKVTAIYNDYTTQILYPVLGNVKFAKEFPGMENITGNRVLEINAKNKIRK
ncbi:hypothetical protein CHISP_2955 [Chitinispirillum alkaliphilum]|nr:hypothetical protein CHISP_2955 [Chitinispirillum alkaliphilum]